MSYSKENAQYVQIPELVKFNIGGRIFTTTKHTLLSLNDTFFTALLSGRLSSLKDETGAYFIDRDPDLFSIILNYLRTNQLFNVTDQNIDMLIHEVEFYSIAPLLKKLKIYEKLTKNPSCGGDVLFQSLLKSECQDPDVKIKQIVAFDNGMVVVFSHRVKFYRLSDNDGWQCVFVSDYIKSEIHLVDFYFESSVTMRFILAIYEKEIVLWTTRRFNCFLNENNNTFLLRQKNIFFKMDEIEEIGRFNLKNSPIDSMFFIGSQLVAISKKKGRVGIWNSSRKWLVQDLKQNEYAMIPSITAFDKAEADYLFLCSDDGIIYFIDMQKFPLRMKDGDLLINKFFKDPKNEEITSISCYHCSSHGSDHFGPEKSIEIAYGTKSGKIRILVHHPETVGQGPQLFQTIQVHLNSISKIMLNNDYLIAMCDQLHIRTWSLVRFRGLISTQPGTKPHSSFTIHHFDDQFHSNVDFGPYGHPREGQKQVFVERPSKNSNYINILYAANGQLICTLKSLDGSPITSFDIMYQHDIRYRQFIVTGHENGNVQVWDLTTAMELKPKENWLPSRLFNKKNLLEEICQNVS